MPICYYCGKLRNESIEPGRSAENPPETRKNEEKQWSKLQMAIARATGRPRSSRPVHSIANCAAHRSNVVPALKKFFPWLKIQTPCHITRNP